MTKDVAGRGDAKDRSAISFEADEESPIVRSRLEWAQQSQSLAVGILKLLNRRMTGKDAIRTVLRMVKEFTGFEAVAIRLREGDDFPYFVTEGFPEAFVEAERYLCNRTESGEIVRDPDGKAVLECMCGNILCGRTDPAYSFFTAGGSFWSCHTTGLLATTTDADRQTRTRNRCNSAGYESVALIPLRSDSETLGLLQLNDSRKDCFTPDMIAFFEGIGASIGIVLARTKVEEDLRRSREELATKVIERTEELRKANEQLQVELKERKKAEKGLRAKERQYRLLADSTPDVIWQTDLDMRFTYVNPAIFQLMGYTPNEFIGTRIRDHCDEANFTRIVQIVSEELSEGVESSALVFETVFLKKNKEPVLVEIRGKVIVDRHGMPTGFQGISRDVTERKQAEKALRASEERYRSLFANMLEGFAYCKMLLQDGKPEDFVYLDCNNSFETLTGLNHVIGKKVTEVIPGIKESNPELFEIYGRVAATGIPEKLETFVEPLGIWFSVSVYSIEKDHFVAVFNNITDRKRTEEALRQSEKEKSLILESATEMLVYYDPDLRVHWANKAAADSLGVAAAALVGRHCYEIWQSRQTPCESCPVVRARETGFPQQGEQIARDGRAWFVRGYPVNDDQGQMIGLIEFIQDITERKRAERALKESEQRYRAVFNIASVGIALVNQRGQFLEANNTLCQLLGHTLEELQEFTILDVTHSEDVARSRETHAAIVTGQREACRLEERYLRKDGTILWSDTAVSAIRDPTGQYQATVGVIRDITSQKKSEEARIRLAAAAEQAVEGIVITDTQGIIQYVNPAYERITGYSRDEVIGGKPSLLADEPSPMQRNVIETLARSERWSGHLVKKRKDGATYEEDVTVTPVLDPHGKVANFVIVKRDVTQEASLQRQLLQAQKMEAIGTLAGGIAHDFNNVLQVTLGYSELLLGDDDLPKEYRVDLQKINYSARRGADLVARLLMFSRKTEIKPQPLDLNRRITDLRKMLERTIPKMIAIDLRLGEKLATINADPTQVDQILMNLAVNARDAMPDGGRLTVGTVNVVLDQDYARMHLEAHPGLHVLLTVSDTGSGMDEDTLEHIFEPFYTTKAVGEGTGLGLAMVHGIVKQHGGLITCHSEPGKGTTFEIYFPALVSEQDEAQTIERPMPRGGSETILLVDDEEFIRDLGSRILEKAGYTVITAANGKEALETYEQRRDEIALVLLDLMMPEMGGKQCLEGLLRLNPSVKVLIASGYSASGSTKEALEAGAKEFVKKPFDMRQVREIVRQVLDAE